jgi:recombination associated protein RdgC
MWFKNLQVYRLGQTFDMSTEVFEQRLQGAVFKGCNRMDMLATGWTPPLGRGSSQLVHAANAYLMICARKEEKIIPAGVVKQLLDDKVAEIEMAEDREIYRRERMRMKEDIIVTLLPHALSRITDQYAYIDTRNGMMVVDAASPAKAEALISQLRTTLGRFPATPVSIRQSISAVMTRWLNGEAVPHDIELGSECELKHPDPTGGVVSCKHQDLGAGEIRNHIKNGKYATRLALQWKERLSFVLHEDMSIKRLRFEDIVMEAEDDTVADDAATRFDLDFTLMTLELTEFLPDLFAMLGGEELSQEAEPLAEASAA